MIRIFLVLLTWLAILAGTALGSDTKGDKRRPNIVLIVADDLGFTDLGSYGSEIATPHLDSLAASGIRFSNFHVSANCAPTRAMLMTGINNHSAGVATIAEMIPSSLRGHPTYQGVLSRDTVTIAQLLRDAGYHTYLSGKWHLGSEPDQRPFNRGFERTLMLADSGADNWEQRPYLILYDKANWYRDGEETTLPDDFYSSRTLVDTLISFIESNHADTQPFFAYLPFQAVHIPVQAPKEFTDRYLDTYRNGWEILREERYRRAIDIGLIPKDAQMARMPTTLEWDQQSDQEKRYAAKSMAVYAGMVEAMDFHIGRLIAWLKETGDFENTIFLFTSDNGAEGTDLNDLQGDLNTMMLGYSQNAETLGEKGSFNFIGPSFASAVGAPLAWYKFRVSEGGMRVPLVISGPGVKSRADFDDRFVWATDIAPTILSLAGGKAFTDTYKGRTVLPMEGRDFSPLFLDQDTSLYGADDYVVYELAGSRAVFHQNFKLVSHAPPYGDNRWYLFDISDDPGETADIADQHPAVVARMQAEWETFKVRVGIQPLPEGYDQHNQILQNYLNKSGIFTWLVALLALMVVSIGYLQYRRLQRKQ